MPAEKFESEETFFYGTVTIKSVENLNNGDSGYSYTLQRSVDYNEEYESYGFVDWKENLHSSENTFNAVDHFDDLHPIHLHTNANQWEVLA